MSSPASKDDGPDIWPGRRVIMRRTGSRGTFTGCHGRPGFDGTLAVVDFDDGGPRNLHISNIEPLLESDLLPEERFKQGQEVVDLVKTRTGVVTSVNGDMVSISFGWFIAFVPARHLQLKN